jgi:2'-5' RNA ligase
MTIDSKDLENDEFGYSCYVISIPAPSELLGRLSEIERAAGQVRAKIPAHITVKGTFYSIASLDGTLDVIRRVVSRHDPFVLGTDGMEFIGPDYSVILGFTVNPEIQALHDDLVANIAPMSKPAYRDDPYRAHMSIVNEVEPEGVAIAKSMTEDIDFGDGLDVNSIQLTARDGVAFGGTWHRLELFKLGG